MKIFLEIDICAINVWICNTHAKQQETIISHEAGLVKRLKNEEELQMVKHFFAQKKWQIDPVVWLNLN